MKIKIGIIQAFSHPRDPDVNANKILDLASVLSKPDLVTLYENWLGRKPLSMREYIDRSIGLLDVSGSRILVSGSSYVRVDESIVSKSLIIDSRGRYVIGDKVYPSNATGERRRVSPGQLPAYYGQYPNVGSVVCVDLVYPEIARYLALRGARIIVNPSFIPSDRSYLWRSLASSRSAENTIYVIHVNATRMRYTDGRAVNGGSFIADPEGKIVFDMGSDPGAGEYIIDLEKIDRIRSRWRYLDDIVARRDLILKYYSSTTEIPLKTQE